MPSPMPYGPDRSEAMSVGGGRRFAARAEQARRSPRILPGVGPSPALCAELAQEAAVVGAHPLLGEASLFVEPEDVDEVHDDALPVRGKLTVSNSACRRRHQRARAGPAARRQACAPAGVLTTRTTSSNLRTSAARVTTGSWWNSFASGPRAARLARPLPVAAKILTTLPAAPASGLPRQLASAGRAAWTTPHHQQHPRHPAHAWYGHDGRGTVSVEPDGPRRPKGFQSCVS